MVAKPPNQTDSNKALWFELVSIFREFKINKGRFCMNFEAYPFEKLNDLLAPIEPNRSYEPLSLTIGEPQFETPRSIQDELKRSTHLLNRYPKSAGEEFLREAMRGFVKRRFEVELDDEQLIPVFGTREALFNFPQFYLHSKVDPTIGFENPFYQIYEGAAKASKAKTVYIDLLKENDFMPILDKKRLKQCDIIILNTPNNPTSSLLPFEHMKEWVLFALENGILLLSDECYSEIYTKDAPRSMLEASLAVGNSEHKNVVVFNSISKRSSAPGLRSGFVAGDRAILKEYMRYRTYVGCASPLPLQHAAAKAWSDDEHVAAFRQKYIKNFQLAKEILGTKIPLATFYLWHETDDEQELTKRAYKYFNLKLLPGSFLGRGGAGKGFVRLALVYEKKEMEDALKRFADCVT